MAPPQMRESNQRESERIMPKGEKNLHNLRVVCIE